MVYFWIHIFWFRFRFEKARFTNWFFPLKSQLRQVFFLPNRSAHVFPSNHSVIKIIEIEKSRLNENSIDILIPILWINDFSPFWQHVEKQRLKLQNSVPVEKRERNRNYRRVEKEYLKRKQKHDDARLNATKARNE